jgi:flagellar hook capping protein FlgD
MDGTASALLSTDVHWGVNNGVISTISPGVFFYFTLVKAPSASFNINIIQTKSNPAWPYIPVMQTQVTLFDVNCGTAQDGTEVSSGQAQVTVTGATPGQVFVACVKYSLKALVGTTMGDGCCYNFATYVNGALVDADADGLQIGTTVACGVDVGNPGGGSTGTGGGPRGSGPGSDGGGYTPGSDNDPIGVLPHRAGVVNSDDQVSDAYRLQAYLPVPNPFRDGMRMAYVVGTNGSRVNIRVYDVAGRMIRTLEDGFQAAGRHLTTWDGRSETGQQMVNGMYFIHVRIGQQARQVRVTILQ